MMSLLYGVPHDERMELTPKCFLLVSILCHTRLHRQTQIHEKVLSKDLKKEKYYVEANRLTFWHTLAFVFGIQFSI